MTQGVKWQKHIRFVVMRKIVEEDGSLETYSSTRSRMDPINLEEHFEEP